MKMVDGNFATPLSARKIKVSEIGFDFDGVIADTAEAFIRLSCEDYGYCDFTRKDITNFELENCVNMPMEIVERIFTQILEDSLGANLQPMAGALRALDRLTAGGQVTIITARSRTEPVIDWLTHHCKADTANRITVVATGDHDDKVRHVKARRITYFVDDRAATCNQLAKAGIVPIVFTQPWNAGKHALYAVDGWEELLDLIDSAR
ncbi:5' nucleotidase, NT5C type [Desulforhopalus singaporensis]|uniref:Haloacid dehalogenase n=1 Tax=Desulforhopalus singaporensis TaxID=91360 RepID=A0A1H0M2U8_9BACT|nr:hypothetical protein [Desulforhopalus singaporensis]SDO74769.1 hypothetical protein SAMN05660330_00962 [Desulforhopalus singaporensis]